MTSLILVFEGRGLCTSSEAYLNSQSVHISRVMDRQSDEIPASAEQKNLSQEEGVQQKYIKLLEKRVADLRDLVANSDRLGAIRTH
jgi:hypothetical protein